MSMELELKDKVAVITGSSRGLGFASARVLVTEGCRVCICARTNDQLAKAKQELQEVAGQSDMVFAVPADVTTTDGIATVINSSIARFGRLDVLVNNVGQAGGGDIVQTTDEDWREALDFTLYPAIRASRLAVPHMRRAGRGAIIMIASIWGRESGGRMTYNAVKAAEVSLAKSMARQLAPDGIRVNSVAPGSISFPGGSWYRRQQEDPEGMAKFIEYELPFGRIGQADEVGQVVAFLASERASWVSGACITVDGCQSRSLI